ncbi:MAG: hypothetical protein ABR913_03740 [Sedimentisphaerales bacterium]
MDKLKKDKSTQTQEQQLAIQIINALNEWMSVGSIENWINRGLVFEERYKQIFCENVPKEYHPNHYLEFRLSIRNKLWMDSIILKLKAEGKDGLAEDIKQRQNELIAEVGDIDKKLEPTNLAQLPNLQLNCSAARLRNALEAAMSCLGTQPAKETVQDDPAETKQNVTPAKHWKITAWAKELYGMTIERITKAYLDKYG